VSTALHTPHSELRTTSVLAALRTWWTILRISLEERLVYRGDFMLGTLMRFLPVVTQIFLWTAVYSAISNIQGYTKDEIIAYLLLTLVARAFSSMPALASGIARSIRDGTIKKYITQPVDMIGFLLLSRVAHKLVYYLVAIVPFALLFYLARGYFTNGWPDPANFAAYVLSLVLAFLLGFFIEATLGMIGFWFLEVSSLLFVYMLFNFFLSGHMFPITMLDGLHFVGNLSWGDVVGLLPLQYLAYFPSAVFLGKITGPELTRGLIIEVAWLVFFIFLCRFMFNRGLRRYSAFGG
jgi:ABC-2 type transport system permease protein